MLISQLVDILLKRVKTKPEAPPLRKLFWVCRRRERERLTDNTDLRTATLFDRVRFKDQLFVLVCKRLIANNILRDELGIKLSDQLLNTLFTVGKLPVTDHDVDTQIVLRLNDRFTACFKRDTRALPRIA